MKTTLRGRRHHIAILKRRIEFVKAKARHDSSEGAEGWYRAEQAALEWAVDVVEAAMLIDTLDELEKVAGLQPDPVAWNRRGEVQEDKTS